MLDVLGQAPVSTTVGVRSMVGANVCYIPLDRILGDGDAGTRPRRRTGSAGWRSLGFRALGITGFPYLGQLVAAADPVPLLAPALHGRPARPPDQAAAAVGSDHRPTCTRPAQAAAPRDLQAEDPRTLTSLLDPARAPLGACSSAFARA